MAVAPTDPALWREVRRRLPAVALVLLPWSWFVVRDWNAWFDAAALLLPLATLGTAIALALLGAFMRTRLPYVVAGSFLLVGLGATVGPWLPRGGEMPDPAFRIVAANIAGEQRQVEQAVADVVAQDGDLVVISETTYEADLLFAEHYGPRILPPGEENNDVRVFSRFGLERTAPPLELPGGNGVWAEVRADPTFALYALHLPSPARDPDPPVRVSFPTHRELIDDLVEAIEADPRPVVVAGDLNLSDRTAGYRRLDDVLDDAMRTSWAGPTSAKRNFGPLLLRIDHIFVPDDWCATDAGRFEISGSDHLGIKAVIGPCPEN